MILAAVALLVQSDDRREALAQYYEAAADYVTMVIDIEASVPRQDWDARKRAAAEVVIEVFQTKAKACGTSLITPDEFPSEEPRLKISPSARPQSVRCVKRAIPFATFEAK